MEGREGQTSRSHVYGITNLYYDFLDGTEVDVSGTSFVSENQALWGGARSRRLGQLGGRPIRALWRGLARTSLEDFGDSYALGGSVGFKAKW